MGVACLALLAACCSDDDPAAPEISHDPPEVWAAWELDIDPDGGADFHLDPDGGDLANPGTAEAPWPGLQEVLEAGYVQRWEPVSHPYEDGAELHLVNPDAPVAPGDRLLLHGGDHGRCTLMDAHNPDYLVIAAAPSESPTLQRLELIGVERCLVEGLTIVGEKSDELGGTILAITSHGWRGPCRYISVRDVELSSNVDITNWTATDWNERAATAVNAGGDYLALHRVTARNVNHGLMMGGDFILVSECEVENFCGDGMRGIGNDQLFEYNTVRNCYEVNDNHDDGFQSFSVNGAPPRERVTLRGNVIIGYTDPEQPYRGTLQGIGCFDGFYIDWVIENNLVATDHWHGITLMGADGCRVVNNTVVDLNDTDPGPPWIRIVDHKDGRPSVDCLIRNNIAGSIHDGDGVAADHNLATTDLEAVFVDPAARDYRLRDGSEAVDAGTTELAPLSDIEGTARPRGEGVDLGAFER
jgi:hypothetical protein